MTHQDDVTDERIQQLIEKFSTGNPLLDARAYDRAIRDCPNEESRQLLRAIKETLDEKGDEFIQRLIDVSEPPAGATGDGVE